MDVDAALKLVQSHYNQEPRLAINQAAMALSDALMAQAAREPLVQKVLFLRREIEKALAVGGAGFSIAVHSVELDVALRELAGWKP